MSSPIKYACWFLIQNGERYLLFKEYLNGIFPKVVDNNECHEKAGYSPTRLALPMCFVALVIQYMSVLLKTGASGLHVQRWRCVDRAMEILHL